MDLTASYRQTDLGVFPAVWEVDFLSCFWNVTDCKHITAKFIANGYPVASIREVQSRFVDLTNAKETTQQYFTLLIEGSRRPKAGDLILSRNATVGAVAQVADWHPPFAMGQDVCLLRKRKQELSTDYLQSVFGSRIITDQLTDLMVGSTFKRVNVRQIKNFRIPMPDPAEQDAIAVALSDADALIESLEQLLAKKRHIKQGAMQELLTGKKRLPGFSGAWSAVLLGDHVSFVRNGANSRAELRDEGSVKYLHYGDIHAATGVFLSPQTLPFLPAEKAKSLGRLRDGDLILVDASEDVDGVGKAVELRDVGDAAVVAGLHTIAARFSAEVLADGFKAYLPFLPSFATHLRRLAAGTKVYATNRAHISSAEVRLPPVSEQTAIATTLTDMDAELTAIEAKVTKARAIKQGMMQELLTGRIRLI